MAQEKKRIGLVLASIHRGVAQDIWSSFARAAASENVTLFIFPGGKLNARRDFENLRNQIYSLVNEENLDGCISSSSSIRYHQSQEEFELFHAGFEPLPYVTLNSKISGHPCVEFDAYNGMKALVTHCIKQHNAVKIAFLQGPDYHPSAHARLNGYYDALSEAGLVADSPGKKNLSPLSPLITDSFDWEEGEAAAAQLFENRSLIPGKDFDTLVGSSDLMALGAIDYFTRHGYHVPADYHAAGFNNSEESRFAESFLSTVRLPHGEMAKESIKILLRTIHRKRRGANADVMIHTEIIIRESCGCAGAYSPGGKTPHNAAGAHNGEISLERTLIKMAGEHLNLDDKATNAMMQPLIHTLLHGESGLFFPMFEKTLTQFFNTDRALEGFLKLIADVKAAGLDIPEKVRRMEPALYRSIFKIREQFVVHASYEKERWHSVLNSLRCDLLGTRDRFSLIQNLARHLPKVGIHTAAIVLYSDEKASIFVGGFSADGISPVREQRFPARLLVPAALKPQYSGGVFMVQPLFIENQSLGYFVHNVSINDGVIIEELRSSISYALKGVFLLEETIRAKRIAEQAERAKTEFLQALENGLHDPFRGVMDRIDALEKRFAPDADKKLHNDLKNLKSFVNSKETEMGSLLDFALARIDELSLKKTVFDPEELLPRIGTFPLLLGDKARLAQCFSIIREQFGGGADRPASVDYAAELSYGGLLITFRGKAAHEKIRQVNIQLAERIILMHGGNFSLEDDHCTLTLPWPTLTGQEPSKKMISSHDHILVLSDPAFLPAKFFTLTQIGDLKKVLPGKTAFMAWNAAGASPEELVKIAGLRRKSELAGIPFLCYGIPPGAGVSGGVSAVSLINMVESALKSPKKGAILFIGSREYWGDNLERFLSKKETRLEKIRIDSIDAFDDTVGEINPLLIIFNNIDIEGAAAVRRHPLTVTVPMLVIDDRIDNSADVTALSQHSRLLLCHRAAVSSPEFRTRIQALIGGDEILPPHTGVLVKKAILYFGQHAKSHISRWKLAETVNVSEDYLTRIFHREMGLSLWDYLNRLRIFLAAELLQRTDGTIQEIALKSGFQDQAYFCRVFKKIHGISPGQLRKQ